MPERENSLRRNIRLAVLLRISLFASAISTPIIFRLAETNGASQSQWLVIQIVFNLMMLLVDLPSGYFADRVSRKFALLIGGLFLVTGAALYGLSVGFTSMIIAEVMLAIGYAFCSGADHTLIYESMLELGESENYEKLVPKLASLEIVSMSAFALIGGTLGIWNLRLPFLLEALVFSSFIVAVLLVVEPRHSGKKQKSLWLAIKSARVLSQHPKRLDLQLGLSAVCFAGLQTILWYYQSVFDERGVPIAWNGVIFMSFHLIAAIAARYSRVVERIGGGYPRALYFPLGIILMVYLLVGLTPFWVIPLFAVGSIARGLNNSLLLAELNRNIPSEVRATLLSLKSLVNRGVYVLLLIIGSVASSRGLVAGDALLVIATAMVAMTLTLTFLLQRRVSG